MTNIRTSQLLAWGEPGIGILALLPIWNLCSASPILGHYAYLGAGRIYLFSHVLPVQSQHLTQLTQHLVLHPWSPSLDKNQGMRPEAQPQIQTRSLIFLLYFVDYLDKNIIFAILTMLFHYCITVSLLLILTQT